MVLHWSVGNGLMFDVFFVDVESFDKFGYVSSAGDSSDTWLVFSGVVAFFDVSVVFFVDFVASSPEPSGAEFAGGG